MKSHQQFFAELKRRHVFKVAWLYGIVAFAVLQAADFALPRLGMPDWTVTFMLAVVLLLFPVALILAWAFEVTPDGMRMTAAAAPGEIEALIAAPASKRWPSGILAILGVLALVGSTWWLARRTAPGAEAVAGAQAGAMTGTAVRFAMADADDDRPSLAVLPFADMSPESDQAYFSDGITEEILNTLAKVRELKVAARTSAFAFKDRQLDLREVGDSLGVEYLIEGSVRKSGDRLRITAQLIDAGDGSHLWSESYDRTMDDVFAIQSEIAQAIAGELRIPLGLDDPAGLVTPTADLEAYDLYLAARGRLRQRGSDVMEAARLFAAAVARDSGWAPAWAGLAEAREISAWYPEAWGEPVPSDPKAARNYWIAGFRARLGPAETAARRALALDPRNASAHVALGSVLRDRRVWGEAEEHYREALALDPDNAEVYNQYGEMLTGTGREAEALPVLERAAALDPAPIRLGMLGWGLRVDDRPAEALPILEQAVATAGRGRLPLVEQNLVEMLIDGRRYDEAERAARAAGDSATLTRVVQAARAGDPGAMPGPLSADQWMWFDQPDSALASLVALGDNISAVDIYRLWLPILDPIRDRPEMADILRRVNLEGRRVERSGRTARLSSSSPAP